MHNSVALRLEACFGRACCNGQDLRKAHRGGDRTETADGSPIGAEEKGAQCSYRAQWSVGKGNDRSALFACCPSCGQGLFRVRWKRNDDANVPLADIAQ